MSLSTKKHSEIFLGSSRQIDNWRMNLTSWKIVKIVSRTLTIKFKSKSSKKLIKSFYRKRISWPSIIKTFNLKKRRWNTLFHSCKNMYLRSKAKTCRLPGKNKLLKSKFRNYHAILAKNPELFKLMKTQKNKYKLWSRSKLSTIKPCKAMKSIILIWTKSIGNSNRKLLSYSTRFIKMKQEWVRLFKIKRHRYSSLKCK